MDFKVLDGRLAAGQWVTDDMVNPLVDRKYTISTQI